ncbi:MAG: carboxypeptidase-like regulatory domain-containing protein [Chloroflexota bacterium]
MKKAIIFTAIYMLALAGIARSQEKSITLLRGAVTDMYGAPVGATMQFTDRTDGKKFNVKSNSKDGSYQQPLLGGRTYDVLFKGYLPIEREVYVEIPPYKTYTEINRDFTVQKLDPGVAIYSDDAFNNDEYKLNDRGLALLRQVKDLILFQGNITFKISVRSLDVKKLPTTRTVVEQVKVKGKMKEKKKTVKIPANEAREEFIRKRIEELRTAAKSLGIRENSLSFEIEPPIPLDKKGNPINYQSTVPFKVDVLVKVDRVLDL